MSARGAADHFFGSPRSLGLLLWPRQAHRAAAFCRPRSPSSCRGPSSAGPAPFFDDDGSSLLHPFLYFFLSSSFTLFENDAPFGGASSLEREIWGAHTRRDQLPELECPARQLRTRSSGARWRATQHLPSTLRAAGGISFAESSDSRARTLIESFLISCKWWSPSACLSVNMRREQFVLLNWVSRPTRTTRVGSNGESAEADHQYLILLRATSSEEAGSGPTTGQSKQSLFQASDELDLFSLPPFYGNKFIGFNIMRHSF